MQPTAAAKIKKEDRQRRRTAERWRKWIEDLRRRQQRQERDRRRRWLLTLLLALLESRPIQLFFRVHFAEARPPEQKRQPQPPKKSEEKITPADTRTEDERRYLYDYAPRRGEEHLEIYDGLTWSDIIEYTKIHRPWVFPAFTPIPGMPPRYAHEPVHIWTLLDHVGSAYHRPDAIVALKLITDESAHDWIDACSKGAGDLTWKDLRKCRSRTPNATLFEFPRYAARWREDQRREAEERKREAKDTPDDVPKPPGVD